jgi:protein-S-isoprenylcysteine O-methyltransferase Ste14
MADTNMTKVWAGFALQALAHAVLLFGAAGTLRWLAGWAFLLLFYAGLVLMTIWLARHDPALLAERMKSPVQRGQPRWDQVLMSVFIVLWAVWLPLMGVDAVRLHWSAMPAILQWIGAAGVVAGMWTWYLAFRENTFLAPVVRIQAERGHRVITTGPYAVVRHPMYAGAVVFFVCAALMLGSWWGFGWALMMSALLAVRTALEDRELQRHLDGYPDYAARVRARLVPGLW